VTTDTEAGLQLLKSTYCEAENGTIALFLGAGVNLPTEKVKTTKYSVYSWEKLLEALHEECRAYNAHSFETIMERWKTWPARASAIRGSLCEEEFARRIEGLIYIGLTRRDDRARLPKMVLAQAPSLRAAICFASAIDRKTKKMWTFRRNPKVSAVVTTNYDCFFGAGWTLYQAFHKQWKVHTWRSAFVDADSADQRGMIYHLHGYIPYRKRPARDVVLTQETYARNYAASGFAAQVLQSVSDTCTLVFLGFSFDDEAVCNVLRRRTGRQPSFAFVRKPDDGRLAQLADLDIAPIPVERYGDIAPQLELVYLSGLSDDEARGVKLTKKSDYWQRLWLGKHNPTRSWRPPSG